MLPTAFRDAGPPSRRVEPRAIGESAGPMAADRLEMFHRHLSAWLAVSLALAFALHPTFCAAHVIQAGSGGFGSGFKHPLTGPDHFLAMFAVGVWGAQMGGRPVWTLPVTFPLIMVLGGIAGILGLPFPGVETGIALSIVALGTAIGFAWRPYEAVALGLIAIFALCHG